MIATTTRRACCPTSAPGAIAATIGMTVVGPQKFRPSAT